METQYVILRCLHNGAIQYYNQSSTVWEAFLMDASVMTDANTITQLAIELRKKSSPDVAYLQVGELERSRGKMVYRVVMEFNCGARMSEAAKVFNQIKKRAHDSGKVEVLIDLINRRDDVPMKILYEFL